jgi:hypothetical protein
MSVRVIQMMKNPIVCGALQFTSFFFGIYVVLMLVIDTDGLRNILVGVSRIKIFQDFCDILSQSYLLDNKISGRVSL